MGSIAKTLRPAPYGSAIHFPAPYPEKTVEELSSNGKLRALVDEHEAIYFQNLGLKNADEFSQFAHAFGWTAHEDIGNPVRRTIHAKNVATANEGSSTQSVYPHNEFGLSAYGRTVLDSDDVDTARTKIENEVKRLPTAQWVWENQSASNPLGDLRVWKRLPAVRDYPHIRETAFFNNVVSRFLNAIDADTLQPHHINKEGRYQASAFFFYSAVEIIKETRSLVPCKEGNVLLLDNPAVQHGREPWTG
ncbi:hypothetical protein LZ31DRAFT_568737 [Colletotrichum somersetense]|nr:hypothetical protein LZ31DRAFT_568737 [Colletotrichum somersetense]